MKRDLLQGIARLQFLRPAGKGLFHARRRLATLAMALLVVLLGYHVVFGANGMVTYQRKRAEHRKLLQENERLLKENERIAERIKSLKTDPGAIEKEAREQLRYARPGEVVFTMPEPPPSKSKATAQKR